MALVNNFNQHSASIKQSLSTLGGNREFSLEFNLSAEQIDDQIAMVNPAEKNKLYTSIQRVLETLVRNTSGYAHRAALSKVTSYVIRFVSDPSIPHPSCSIRSGELHVIFPPKAMTSNQNAFQHIGKNLPNTLQVQATNSSTTASIPSYAAGLVQTNHGSAQKTSNSSNQPFQRGSPQRGTGRGMNRGAPNTAPRDSMNARNMSPGRGRGAPNGNRGNPQPRGTGVRKGNPDRGSQQMSGRGRGAARGAVRGGRAAGGNSAQNPVQVSVTSASQTFELGDITPELTLNFEEHKSKIEEHLKIIGKFIETEGKTSPFSLKVLPSSIFCDNEASEDGPSLKNKLFSTIDYLLERFCINMSRIDADKKLWLGAMCPARILTIIVDEKNGGDMYGNPVFKNGELQLSFKGRSLSSIRCAASSIGSNIEECLKDSLGELADDSEKYTKILEIIGAEDKKKIDELLASFGEECDGAPFKMETEMELYRMDDIIASESSYFRGKILNVLYQMLEKCFESLEYKTVEVSEKVPSRTIVFRMADCPRRALGYLQIVLEDGKLVLVGPDSYYTTAQCGWSDIGCDFSEACEPTESGSEDLDDLLAQLGQCDSSESSDGLGDLIAQLDNGSDSDDGYSYSGGGSGGGSSGVSSSKPLKTCNMCKGHGHRVCTLCHGKGCKGRVGCRGSGRANAKCTSCRGTGKK